MVNGLMPHYVKNAKNVLNAAHSTLQSLNSSNRCQTILEVQKQRRYLLRKKKRNHKIPRNLSKGNEILLTINCQIVKTYLRDHWLPAERGKIDYVTSGFFSDSILSQGYRLYPTAWKWPPKATASDLLLNSSSIFNSCW